MNAVLNVLLALCFLGHSLSSVVKQHHSVGKSAARHDPDMLPYYLIKDHLLEDEVFYAQPSENYLPSDVDWRTEGLVTKVKNQGHVGSCWDFSAVGALEGQIAKKYKHLVSLSEQNLLDCNKEYEDNIEYASSPARAYQYIMKYGVNSEDTYPYEDKRGVCRFNSTASVLKIKGWRHVEATEEALKVAVATVGPISVCIGAHGLNDTYRGGIYYSSSCSKTVSDHCMLVVGYGSMTYQRKPTEKVKTDDYWLVKNSWGPEWGEAGYVRIARNKNNMCGIANWATYPIL